MHDRAVILWERDSIVLGLLSMSKCDPSEYAKEGNIANDNNEYAVGNNGNDEPLRKGKDGNNAPIANDNHDKPSSMTSMTNTPRAMMTSMPMAKTTMSMPGAMTTMMRILRAMAALSMPRAKMMMSPLTTMTTTSMLRRATLQRATAMTSPFLRAKTTTSTPRVTTTTNTMTNINKQQPTKNTQQDRGGKGEEVQLGLILDDAGAAAIVAFVNSAGGLLSKLPLATIVHISAGQKEEVPADNR
jgi:hypothetical protein